LVSWEPAAPAFSLQLQADKEIYAHDHLVTLTLRPSSDEVRQLLKKSTAPVVAWVERDGTPVVTVGEMEKVRLGFDKAHGFWRARWPIPWNAPDGIYSLRLTTTPTTDATKTRHLVDDSIKLLVEPHRSVSRQPEQARQGSRQFFHAPIHSVERLVDHRSNGSDALLDRPHKTLGDDVNVLDYRLLAVDRYLDVEVLSHCLSVYPTLW
jgi:hypothetical protein